MEYVKTNVTSGTSLLTIAAKQKTNRALVLVHGRGSDAINILALTEEFSVPDSCVVVAPEANNYSWYPERFTVPQEKNEPKLSESIAIVHTTLIYLQDTYGVHPDQIVLAGFSQGACLIAEYSKRYPRRYAGLAIMSGGIIGDDSEVQNDIPGLFKNTPIYLGCDEHDMHIPKERVIQSSEYFAAHGAKVTQRLYQNLGHTIHSDAIEFIKIVLSKTQS